MTYHRPRRYKAKHTTVRSACLDPEGGFALGNAKGGLANPNATPYNYENLDAHALGSPAIHVSPLSVTEQLEPFRMRDLDHT